MFFVCKNSIPLGFIQYCEAGHDSWFDQPQGTFGIDLFISDVSYLGKGYGTCFIKQFVEELLKKPEVKQGITDVDPKNLRAIKCYEKVGFVSAGTFETQDGHILLMQHEVFRPKESP